MKRGSGFLIAFIASTVTFGSLMAFAGPQRSGWNRYNHDYYGGWRHHHHYDHTTIHLLIAVPKKIFNQQL